MKINCPEIELALKLAEADGNEVVEVSSGWSNVKNDIRMAKPLTSQLKEQIASDVDTLQYWKYKGSPHNKPDEGFICKEHSISISFPISS